ncbi:MAG: ABC transporter permease [Phycisphaerales bacterium JB039]
MQHGTSSTARPLWKRLLVAQESGLLLVIVLMGLGLTIFGGSKESPVRRDVPAGATVVVLGPDGREAAPGELPLTEIVAWEVRPGAGPVRSYPRAEGWRYDASESAMFGRISVNKFLEPNNLLLLASNASFIAVIAVGMTGVIVLAGIDLSVGSIYALAAVLGAMVMSRFDAAASVWLTVPAALVICCGVGLLLGLANGAMIVGFRLHPFIITLGTMSVFRGVAFLSTRGQTVGGLPGSLQTDFFKLQVGGVEPVIPLIMLVVALAGWFALSRTVFGRRIYAIGGNETAARYAGIPVGRIKIAVYAIVGMLAGLSACMYIGYYGAATSSAGQMYELRVIAATVVGGASLLGGRGTALGAVLGAIVIELINNGISILNVDNSYLQVITGAAVIIAVVIDRMKQGFGNR